MSHQSGIVTKVQCRMELCYFNYISCTDILGVILSGSLHDRVVGFDCRLDPHLVSGDREKDVSRILYSDW